MKHKTNAVRRSSGTVDLTQGPIIRNLIAFFLPVAAGTLFQQLYNAVDAFVVTKYVGTDALAAVGGTPACVSNLVIGFCVALTGGCSVIISQLYGARQFDKVPSAVKTSFLFSILLGLFVGGAVIWGSPSILTWLKTTSDTFEGALLYQRIYFSGAVFMLVFNMGSGILRAVGDSRFPFLCLFVSCGLNIGLDIFFTVSLRMGVAGVAWATVIAQGVSALMVTLKMLFTKEPYRLQLRAARFSLSTLGPMLAIGVPSGLQSSMYGISNLILQTGVNSLGTVVVASWAMSGKIDGVYWACCGAFATAITTFVGQNYGAGNMKRIKEGTKKGFLLFMGMTVLLSGLILTFARPALHLLTDDDAVRQTTRTVMLFFVPAYVLWSIIEHYSGVLRGIGDTVTPSVIIALGICLVRIVWMVTVFRAVPTLSSLCLVYSVSWIITDVPIFLYYKHKEKRLLRPAA